MTVDDLERILKAMPLRAPSPDLDRRVMESKAGPHPTRRARRWLPELAAAALVAFAGGLISWMAWPPRAPTTATSTNPFDFTRPSSFFPPGEMDVVIRSSKGN
jgi:hypothetical protein